MNNSRCLAAASKVSAIQIDARSCRRFCLDSPGKCNLSLMFNVVLYEPEIPPNTGNIARLCGATFSRLHIVGVTGFRMDDKALRRAGLDYWKEVSLERHIGLEDLYAKHPQARFFYFTTKATGIYTTVNYQEGDFLVFGPETRGLPDSVLAANADKCYRIPMPNPRVRSLNLATSVGIVLYEALRQNGFGANRRV